MQTRQTEPKVSPIEPGPGFNISAALEMFHFLFVFSGLSDSHSSQMGYVEGVHVDILIGSKLMRRDACKRLINYAGVLYG
jgi:hypothetical protein